MKTKFQVKLDQIGNRLDKVLATFSEISSRSFAQDLIEKEKVWVNGQISKASQKVAENDLIEIEFPEVKSSELIPFPMKLDVLFEDENLLVINKPSGLVVHPSAGHEDKTLVHALLNHTKQLSMKNEQRPGIVHRIDKETSGLLVVAKNDRSHELLAAQFKNKTTHRIYYALVQGNVPRTKGVCQSYLARHPVDRKRYASVKSSNKIITEPNLQLESAKWAVTHFQKIQQANEMSYLKLQLETGRTHQIRVHMSELGHPLVGDLTYGYSQKKAKQLGTKRFYLHAAELGFVHPLTDENLLFKQGWPEEDKIFLNNLGFKVEI